MAAMQFSCPHCSGLFQVDTSFGGQQISCPHCRGVVTLPALGPQTVAPTVHPQPTSVQPSPPTPIPAPLPVGTPPTPVPQQPRPVPPAPQHGATPTHQRPVPRTVAPGSSDGPGATASPNRPVTPVSQKASASTASAIQRTPSGSATPISLPTADDPLSIKIREPVKTVGVGDVAVELKSLSSESRARWRLKKNLILWTFGLIVMGIALAILLLAGPISF